VVARHAADKEVQKENFLCVRGSVENVQFVFEVGDNNLLVVFRSSFFLSSFVMPNSFRKIRTSSTLLASVRSGLPCLRWGMGCFLSHAI
jgi:hypothetical protein